MAPIPSAINSAALINLKTAITKRAGVFRTVDATRFRVRRLSRIGSAFRFVPLGGGTRCRFHCRYEGTLQLGHQGR